MFKKDPLKIVSYKTYGHLHHLYLKGRALEDENIDLTKEGWLNLIVNSYKQFETDEIGHSDLVLELDTNISFRLKTDAEGYYLLNQTVDSLSNLVDDEGWLEYKVSYLRHQGKQAIQNKNLFKGQMLVPCNSARFGVITDIDDTILHTGVTSRLKWKVAVNTFLRSPSKREALSGAAEFYRSLHLNDCRTAVNPIFYVSNSPWNLYKYLEYFLEVNEFPKGPILLRDFRTPFDRTPKKEMAHKDHEIHNILNTYPNLSFILIGDCGEKDPYIYMDVVSKFPGRIQAIYLRSVSHPKRMSKVSSDMATFDQVPVLIVGNSEEAVCHARGLGFID